MTARPGGLRSVVLICTRNRPVWVCRAVQAVARDRPTVTVVVVDASDDDATGRQCRQLSDDHPGLVLHHVPATRRGLTRQRNQGIDVCAAMDVDVVHFLDDDAEILPGYLDAVEARFVTDPSLAGVGGRTVHASAPAHPKLSALFLLSGSHPYTVRRSGRVVMPRPDDEATGRIEGGVVRWLQGFAMSYRMDVLRRHRFDDRLSGYCFGEDRDFAFRVSRHHRLAVEPAARCVHHRASENRLDHRRLGFQGTVLTWVWVGEQRGQGVSRPAFWWSVLGDALTHLGAAAGGRQATRDSLAHLGGILDAVRSIAAGRAEGIAHPPDTAMTAAGSQPPATALIGGGQAWSAS